MADETEPRDIWAMLEETAPDGCEAVQDLYSWSLNYDAGHGPFALFLDLIGWTADEMGDGVMLYPYADHPASGYLEIAKLAHALEEYADRPHEVREYVDELMAAEVVG